jgi:hypothetical protein
MFRVCGRDVGRWGILIGMHIRTWKRGLLYPNEGTELSLVPDCGILYGVGCSCLRRRRWPDRLREVYLCAARMWAAAVVITALVGTAQRPYCNRICRVVTHTWTVERMQIQMLCHLHRCNVRHNMRGPCVPMLRRCVAQDQQPTALMPCQALPNNQQSPPWIVGQGQGHGHSVHAFSSTWQGMTRASSQSSPFTALHAAREPGRGPAGPGLDQVVRDCPGRRDEEVQAALLRRLLRLACTRGTQ